MSNDIDGEFALPFPIEFLIRETPRSLQSRNAKAREEWKRVVRQAARARIASQRELVWLDDRPLAAKILYFPPAPMAGDVDNIVKLILDGMLTVVYLDDRVIERVTVQKFEPGIIVGFASITETLEQAIGAEPPVVYIRIDDDLGWRATA